MSKNDNRERLQLDQAQGLSDAGLERDSAPIALTAAKIALGRARREAAQRQANQVVIGHLRNQLPQPSVYPGVYSKSEWYFRLDQDKLDQEAKLAQVLRASILWRNEGYGSVPMLLIGKRAAPTGGKIEMLMLSLKDMKRDTPYTEAYSFTPAEAARIEEMQRSLRDRAPSDEELLSIQNESGHLVIRNTMPGSISFTPHWILPLPGLFKSPLRRDRDVHFHTAGPAQAYGAGLTDEEMKSYNTPSYIQELLEQFDLQ